MEMSHNYIDSINRVFSNHADIDYEEISSWNNDKANPMAYSVSNLTQAEFKEKFNFLLASKRYGRKTVLGFSIREDENPRFIKFVWRGNRRFTFELLNNGRVVMEYPYEVNQRQRDQVTTYLRDLL